MAERDAAYGEHRQFRGLEKIAIQRRLNAARHLLDIMLLATPNAPLEVLELGCGFWGRNLTLLKEEYPNVEFTGMDFSVSKDFSGIQLVQADISTWKPSRKFDAVLSLAVVEHLVDPQYHFHLMADCIRKGGRIGLTTPSPQSHLVLKLLAALRIFDQSEIKDHKLYLSETGIRILAANSNLLIEEFYSFSFGMNQWALMVKN